MKSIQYPRWGQLLEGHFPGKLPCLLPSLLSPHVCIHSRRYGPKETLELHRVQLNDVLVCRLGFPHQKN